MNYPFKNNLILDPKIFKKSIYGNKQKYREYVNKAEVCSLIKNHQDYIYKEDSPQKRVFNSTKDQLKKYLKKWNDKGYFEVETALPKHKWGRHNPIGQVGLAVMHRATRHSLVHKKYIDCDMVNAQPFIINTIIKQNKTNTRNEQELSVPFLEQYCENRDAMLEAIQAHYGVVKDDAKKLIIAILNGGHYKTWETKMNINPMETETPQDIISLYETYQPFLRAVYDNNKKIFDDVIEKQKDLPDHYDLTEYTERQMERTTGALFYTTIERHIQETAIDYLVRRKGFNLTEDFIPSQDGFMYIIERDYGDLINDIQEIVAMRWGIPIQFKLKAFDEKFEIMDFNDTYNWIEIISRSGIADFIIAKLGDDICYENGTLYVYLNKRWCKNEDADILLKRYINTKIYEEVKDLIETNYMEDDIDKQLKEIRSLTETKASFTDIIQQLKGGIGKPKVKFDSNPYLLPFKNGVIHLLDLETLPVDDCFYEHHRDDYITIDTGYDYDYEPASEEIKNWINSIMPDPAKQKLLLQYLASCLDGKIYQKFFMLCGGGGNGKGSLIDYMEAVLTIFFIKASNSLLKSWGEVAGGTNSDLVALKNKRMIIFEEMGKSKVPLDTNLLNKMTGGGQITARDLFKTTEQFELEATFGGTANVMPPLADTTNESDKRRWIVEEFDSQFTEDQHKVGTTYKCDGQTRTYRQADAKYSDKQWYQTNKLSFINLLLEAYKQNIQEQKEKCAVNEAFRFIQIKFDLPDSVKAKTEKFLNGNNLIDKAFNRTYIKTDKKTDRIKSKDIKETILSSQTFQRASEFDRKKFSVKKEFEKYIGSKFIIVQDKSKVKCIEFYRLRTESELEDYDKQFIEDDDEEDESIQEANDDDVESENEEE